MLQEKEKVFQKIQLEKDVNRYGDTRKSTWEVTEGPGILISVTLNLDMTPA